MCAAFDRGTWRTITVHYGSPANPGSCWQRRHELASKTVTVVQDPEREPVTVVGERPSISGVMSNA